MVSPITQEDQHCMPGGPCYRHMQLRQMPKCRDLAADIAGSRSGAHMLLAWLAISCLPSISTSGCGLPDAKIARPPAQKQSQVSASASSEAWNSLCHLSIFRMTEGPTASAEAAD